MSSTVTFTQTFTDSRIVTEAGFGGGPLSDPMFAPMVIKFPQSVVDEMNELINSGEEFEVTLKVTLPEEACDS